MDGWIHVKINWQICLEKKERCKLKVSFLAHTWTCTINSQANRHLILVYNKPVLGIRPEVRIWIPVLLSSSKNSKKNLYSTCFVTSLWLLWLLSLKKNDVNVASISTVPVRNKQQIISSFHLEVHWRKYMKQDLEPDPNPNPLVRTKKSQIPNTSINRRDDYATWIPDYQSTEKQDRKDPVLRKLIFSHLN